MATGRIQYHNYGHPEAVDCDGLHSSYKEVLIRTAERVTKYNKYNRVGLKSFLKNIPNFTKEFPESVTFCILGKEEIMRSRDSIVIGHIKVSGDLIHLTTKITLDEIIHAEKRELLNKLLSSIMGLRFCTVEWYAYRIDYDRAKTMFLLDDLCKQGIFECIEVIDKAVMITAYRKVARG